MRRISLFYGLTAGLLLAPATMLCQIQNPGPEAFARDHQTRVMRSSAKLQCKLQLDRTVYFPADAEGAHATDRDVQLADD